VTLTSKQGFVVLQFQLFHNNNVKILRITDEHCRWRFL